MRSVGIHHDNIFALSFAQDRTDGVAVMGTSRACKIEGVIFPADFGSLVPGGFRIHDQNFIRSSKRPGRLMQERQEEAQILRLFIRRQGEAELDVGVVRDYKYSRGFLSFKFGNEVFANSQMAWANRCSGRHFNSFRTWAMLATKCIGSKGP